MTLLLYSLNLLSDYSRRVYKHIHTLQIPPRNGSFVSFFRLGSDLSFPNYTGNICITNTFIYVHAYLLSIFSQENHKLYTSLLLWRWIVRRCLYILLYTTPLSESIDFRLIHGKKITLASIFKRGSLFQYRTTVMLILYNLLSQATLFYIVYDTCTHKWNIW